MSAAGRPSATADAAAADLAGDAGFRVRPGDTVTFAKTVGESDVYLFAGITGDLAFNHVDEQRMSATRYGRRIVHGALMIGFMSTCSTRLIETFTDPAADGFTPVSLGYDGIRFLQPVFIGDTVTVSYRVETIDPARQRSTAGITIVNQHGDTVTVGRHIMKWVADTPVGDGVASGSGETLRWGGEEVPVLRRPWKRGPQEPYRRTYDLEPGQSWWEAPSTSDQREHYALGPDGNFVPVGALIAAELVSEGAADAAFVELWNGIVLVGGDLVCVAADGRLGEVLDRVKAANNGSLGGFPDVLAIFEDGRVAFREAKSVSGKDKLQPNQHAMADLLRREFGSNADFAVVEWDCPDGSDQRGA